MIDDGEFYIGYEPRLPAGHRRVVVGAIAGAFVIATTTALLVVSLQRPLADARFEFGRPRTFEGYLSLTPSPMLLVREAEALRPHWLVAPGKFGPAAALGPAAPGWVTLSGTLVERARWRMIEVVPGSVRILAQRGPPPAPPDPQPSPRVLTGEIVDSKCYLGVMNPGERTVHRDCATRCLLGGVPAMLAYRDETGSHLALLLGADVNGHGAGQTVTLTGVLTGPDDAQVFTVGGQ
jgi:hypothetical protein